MEGKIHSAPSPTGTSLRFPAAPWPRNLKLISAGGTALVLAAGVGAYLSIPAVPGFTHFFGLGIALVFPGILVVALLYAVTGYVLKGNDLFVERPFFSTRIPLSGLSRIQFEPRVCRGSVRIWGNGGLYSFTGLYRSKAVGTYRLFGTDLSRSVVLHLPRRAAVVTPAEPRAFLEYLRLRFPSAVAEPGEFPP
mgnify:CR=1 FL=1